MLNTKWLQTCVITIGNKRNNCETKHPKVTRYFHNNMLISYQSHIKYLSYTRHRHFNHQVLGSTTKGLYTTLIRGLEFQLCQCQIVGDRGLPTLWSCLARSRLLQTLNKSSELKGDRSRIPMLHTEKTSHRYFRVFKTKLDFMMNKLIPFLHQIYHH